MYQLPFPYTFGGDVGMCKRLEACSVALRRGRTCGSEGTHSLHPSDLCGRSGICGVFDSSAGKAMAESCDRSFAQVDL